MQKKRHDSKKETLCKIRQHQSELPSFDNNQNTLCEKTDVLEKSACISTTGDKGQGSIVDVNCSSQGKSVLEMVTETAKELAVQELGKRNRQKKRHDSEGQTLCVIPEQKSSSASCEDSQYTEQERSDVLEKSGVLTIEGEGQGSIMDANSSLPRQSNSILEMDTEMINGPPLQRLVGNKQGEKKDRQKEILDSKGEISYVILEQKNSSSSCEDSQDTKHEKSEVLEKSACVLTVGGKGQGSIMGANSNFLCQGNSVLEIDAEMAEYPPSQLVKERKQGKNKNRRKKRHDSEGETLSVSPEQKNPSTSCESSQNTSAPAVCDMVLENGEKSEKQLEKLMPEMAEDPPSQPLKGGKRNKKRQDSEGETLSVISEQKNPSPSCESSRNASCPAVYNMVVENGEKPEEKLEKVMAEMAEDPPSQPVRSLVASSTSGEVERIASAVNSCLSVSKGRNDIEVSYSLGIRASIGPSRRKLLILDVNGLLADVILKARVERKPDIWIARRAIFKRPFCDDFLRFCFENFDVGVWSSRSKKYLYELTDYLLADMSPKLLFCWDASRCTDSGSGTVENKQKPLVFKELKKIWEKVEPSLPWEGGHYDESNTLLLDDSPYKALLNPAHTAVFPFSYTYMSKDDNSLGPGGDLRVYMEHLAAAENVQKYVQEHPFGQQAINETSSSWPFYKDILNKLATPIKAIS